MCRSMFHDDPVNNVILNGIKGELQTCWEHKLYRAVGILIYAGIDAMAYLAMPEGQSEVKGIDYEAWCDRFLCVGEFAKLSGAEFYSARCALLHTYGTQSRRSKKGTSRQLGFSVGGSEAVTFRPHISTELAMVSLCHLKDRFLSAVDEYIVWAQLHTPKVLNERSDWMMAEYPVQSEQASD